MFRRPHDVGEEDREQYTIENRHRPGAGEELLYFVQDFLAATGKRQVVIPGQFDEAGIGDPAGHGTAMFGADVAIPVPAYHECGRLNRRQR